MRRSLVLPNLASLVLHAPVSIPLRVPLLIPPLLQALAFLSSLPLGVLFARFFLPCSLILLNE